MCKLAHYLSFKAAYLLGMVVTTSEAASGVGGHFLDPGSKATQMRGDVVRFVVTASHVRGLGGDLGVAAQLCLV